MKILDTSVLIDIDRGDPSIKASIARLKEEDRLLVSAVSVFEFWWGICNRYDDPFTVPVHIKKGFFSFFTPFEVVSIDTDISVLAATLSVEMKQKGQPIDLHDYYIAATAVRFDSPVITKNIKHFSRLKQIKIEQWPYKTL